MPLLFLFRPSLGLQEQKHGIQSSLIFVRTAAVHFRWMWSMSNQTGKIGSFSLESVLDLSDI